MWDDAWSECPTVGCAGVDQSGEFDPGEASDPLDSEDVRRGVASTGW